MLGNIIGLFAVAAVFSGLISYALGLDDGGMRYDWRTERMVYVPTRRDMMLDIIIKS